MYCLAILLKLLHHPLGRPRVTKTFVFWTGRANRLIARDHLPGEQMLNLLLNPKYELGMKLSQEYYAFKRR